MRDSSARLVRMQKCSTMATMPTNTLPNCAGVAPLFRARPMCPGAPLRLTTTHRSTLSHVARTPQLPMPGYHAVETDVVAEEVAGIRPARDVMPRVTGQWTS